MADAVEVLDDRNLALFHDGADQAFATARNHEVEAIVALQEHAHEVMARFGHELHGILVDAVFFKSLVENPGEALCGVERFLTATENHGIARLKAKASAVNRHVRAAFKNKEHRTYRHGDTANLDAVLEFTRFKNTTERVGKCGDFFGTLGHGFDAGIVQSQAIHLGIVELAGGSFEVKLVGGENFRLLCTEDFCNTCEHGCALFSAQCTNFLARVLCIVGELVRVFFQINVILCHIE